MTVRATANARALGSRQLDAMQKLSGTAGFRPAASAAGAGTGSNVSGVFRYSARAGTSGASELLLGPDSANGDVLSVDASLVARTSTETRSANAAYHPRIHA